MKTFLFVSLSLSLWTCAVQTAEIESADIATDFVVTSKQVSTDNRFQAISIDEKGGLWISGTKSSVYHSVDQGLSWVEINTPETDKDLQFRDIQVVNDQITLMSAGEGSDSRLYMSDDFGDSWLLSKQGQSPDTFYDCFSMLDESTGWLYGDSVNETFAMLKTTDGAKTWQPVTLPFTAQKNEGGFASSGTCLNHNTKGDIVIGTGNSTTPRLLIKQKNQDWQSIESPYKGGEAAGIFSVQFDKDNLYTFGGSLKTKDKPAPMYKYSLAKSKWFSMPASPLNGAIYGSSVTKEYIFINNPEGIAVLAKALESDKSTNVWRKLSDLDIWAMACKDSNCWGVGANGTVVSITWK